VAVARSSSDDSAIRHVLPVLWMTPCLPIMGYIARGQYGRMLKTPHQGAAPGEAKYDVDDCLVNDVRCT